MTKAKKIHPADIATREQIKNAASFNVHVRFGPTEKINVEAETLVKAIKAADDLKLQYPGKRPMIYAITPEKFSIFVTEDIKEEAMKSEASTKKSAKKSAKKADKPQKIVKDKARDGAKPAKDNDYPTISTEDRYAAADKRAVKAAQEKAEAPARGKRAEILKAAQCGTLPPEPDFSAPTHARFRAQLARLVAMANDGDVDGLNAEKINPISSSPKAMDKYRTLAIIAIEARAAWGSGGEIDPAIVAAQREAAYGAEA